VGNESLWVGLKIPPGQGYKENKVMPAIKRIKTNSPGVFFILCVSPANSKPEKIFCIRYRKAGKMIEEKAGWQFQDDMTPARAASPERRGLASPGVSI